MLDLNDVALFVQVVRAGSFAEAGRRLGLPSNTVSRRVQQLEEHLGARLMQRSTRKLTLTHAGNAFYARSAEQVESLVESAQDLIDEGQSPSGLIRVAAPADFFNWYRMEWTAEFLAMHPKVRVEFVLSDARADLLAEGIDVAFRAGRDLEPNLVARLIGKSGAMLVASPDYIAAHGAPQSVAALADQECVLSGRPAARNIWPLTGPEGESEVEVSGRFRANVLQALLDATLNGLGIGLLPIVTTAPHRASGKLVRVLPNHRVEGVGVYFVYLSRHQLPRAVSAFIDFSMQRMREQGLMFEADD
jgi:LysR family transcriptional regulator AphB